MQRTLPRLSAFAVTVYLFALPAFFALPAMAQTGASPPAVRDNGAQGVRPTAPSTGQTVPNPRSVPADADTRGRDTGAASGAAGPNIPGTGTPRISTDTPPAR